MCAQNAEQLSLPDPRVVNRLAANALALLAFAGGELVDSDNAPKLAHRASWELIEMGREVRSKNRSWPLSLAFAAEQLAGVAIQEKGWLDVVEAARQMQDDARALHNGAIATSPVVELYEPKAGK